MHARLLLVAVLACAACAGTTTNLSGEVTYAKDAKGNYELGEKELKDHNFPEATQYFQFTKSKFPYSQYAALAELRLADASFEQDKFVEAIDGYKNFLKDHPTHGKVDFASFQIAKAHYKDLPSDFFLFPPSHEKDQQQLVEAQAALQEFVSLFPRSEFRVDADKMMLEVRRKLAEHEMYVAGFYERRGYKKAAAWRYEGVAKNFPDTPMAQKAASKAADLYAHLPSKTRRPGEAPPAEPAVDLTAPH